MNWGYMGMAISAFLAASILPFSSEAVMVGLLAAGLDMWALVAWGTVGNVLGSLFNYGIGRLGKMEWIEKYLKIKPEKLEKGISFIQKGPGAIIAFFSFLPIWGELIIVALGFTRANKWVTNISMFAGKLLRYLCIAKGVEFFM